jgi:tetratricopeptide (TPR) repeat protein
VRQNQAHLLLLKHRLSISLALTVLIVAAFLIYFPGLSGPYVLDDGENIAKNEAAAIEEISPTSLWRAMQSNDSGPFKRPLATLSFALNHYYSGGFDNTFPFKLTNLIIHISNGILLLFLTLTILRISVAGRRFTSTEQLNVAVLTALLWTLHPIQLTNILYVVQRMNSLSALFVILGLIIFMEGRQRFDVSAPKSLWLMGIGVFFGTLLGISSKENAALLPLFALTIEYCFCERDNLDAKKRLQLQIFYVVTIVIPLAIFLTYLYVNPGFLFEAYKVRHFSMIERLLTESRVLWHYVGFIVLPDTHQLGLFHDDIRISRGLLAPPGTLLAIFGLLVLLLVTIVKRKQIPIISFAVLWFLVGHLLESSLFGLEVAYEHRNYLPAFGILFAISYACVWASRHWNARLRFIIAISILLTLGFATWSRANTWKDLYSLAEANVANHPDSPRANEFAARVNVGEKGDIAAAIRYTIQALNNAPDEAGFHVNLHLFLAMFSSQINQNMKSAGIINMKGMDLQIDGLPRGIITTTDDNHVRLVYPPSTNETVEELLKTRPITVHTLASLEGLGRCITKKPDICQPLSKQGLKWYAIAADNTLATKTDKALILNNAAEVYAHMSDYAMALAYVDRATQIMPDVLYYRLKKIEYLVNLRRLDEAKSLLSSIERIDPERDIRYFNNRTTIKSVQDMYADAIKNQHATPARQGFRP